MSEPPMNSTTLTMVRRSLRRSVRWGRDLLALALPLTLLSLATGCASLTNPGVEAVPVRMLPPELLAKPKDCLKTIPLSTLGQRAPDAYRLAAGDVLGVWIEGVLQDSKQPGAGVTTVATPPFLPRDQRRVPPSIGSPIAVRADGMVRLPMIEPIRVEGMTVGQAEDAIRNAYVSKKILPEGRERIIVSLMAERQTHVVVLRQESGNITVNQLGGLTGGKRSTGHMVDLPAYENDVLHALALSGGMPGLDAYNQVIIYRNSFQNDIGRQAIIDRVKACPEAGCPDLSPLAIRIPLRAKVGEPLPFGPDDVILHDGDVVFLEARDTDLFYTGGLLPANENILPRDYDLDVIQAITRVRGPLINGAYGTNQLGGNLIQPGIGGPSPSLLTVYRKTPDGTQIPIRVDLNLALKDSRERLIVAAGDVLILQETPGESTSRYLTQTFFNFNLLLKAINTGSATGVVDIASPDRLSTRGLTIIEP